MQQVEPNQAFSHARTDEAATARQPGLLDRAGVAHELGNLIQIASSAVNILARSSRFDVAPALEPVISGARASLDRAGVLVRQSLRQTESKAAEAERVDIAQSLREVMDLIQPAWAPKYRVELELGAALPAMKCAPLGLQGAILNLALNARDSMPDGGVISIGAVAISPDTADTYVELRVGDRGVGMSRDTMKRAFDPFFTTKSGGLGGVGLSMVKRFVEEAGGRIELSSVPGEGTTVALLFPVVC